MAKDERTHKRKSPAACITRDSNCPQIPPGSGAIRIRREVRCNGVEHAAVDLRENGAEIAHEPRFGVVAVEENLSFVIIACSGVPCDEG
jgi:hypothetical protein